MTDNNTARQTVFEELVTATKILLHEGILDTFGHISARDPEDPNSFFLAQKLAPSLITTDDIQRFNLDGETSDNRPSYLERYIHSEIYKARPDVQCVLHSHSPAVLPYCFIDQPLRPVTHMGAFMGEAVPVYEIRDKHGDETDFRWRPQRLRGYRRKPRRPDRGPHGAAWRRERRQLRPAGGVPGVLS